MCACVRMYIATLYMREKKHIVNSIFLYNLLYCNTMFKIACSFVLCMNVFLYVYSEVLSRER